MVGARPTSHGRAEKDAKRTEELQKRMFRTIQNNIIFLPDVILEGEKTKQGTHYGRVHEPIRLFMQRGYVGLSIFSSRIEI